MLLRAVVGLCCGVEGRVCGVDCVCATEPPWCSSGCEVTDAGAAAIARALEKNTTLQRLDLSCEFVVLCVWRGVDYGLCCCGLLLDCVLGLRGVCVVLIVCAPLNRRDHQPADWGRRQVLHGLRKL